MTDVSAERWQSVKNIFLDALDVEETERENFLASECRQDAEIRDEVEKLLAAHFAAENFIESPPAEIASIFQINGNFSEPKHFGNYRIINEIGAGGMGAVFLAERDDGEFDQRVAIKIVRQSIAEKELVNRFRQERQILAGLNHPYIAKLLDGGITETGEPFLVMEYVDGRPLLEFAEGLETDGRLKLFLKICSAVSYAHRNLIVHRDIKPSNILVTPDGEPKLLDFGLAKVLDFESDQTQTATAFRAMTPAYASPEQLRGEQVTTASDIYSLGVVLYELLTGSRPFDFNTNSLEEMLRVVATSQPVPPSSSKTSKFQISNFRSNKKVGNTQSARRNPHSFRGDLDNIVLMSLRKEPERRYKSVEDFATDIERHLQGLPVSARRNTFGYRSEKFIRRNKIGVTAASLLLLTIISGSLISLWQADVARSERDLANSEKLKAERINAFLSAALAYSDPASAVAGRNNRRDATISQMLDDVAPQIENELVGQPDVRASLQRTVGLAYKSQLRFAEAESYLNAALATQLELYGEDHHEIAHTLTLLSFLQQERGDYAGAERSLHKAIAIYRAMPAIQPFQVRIFSAALVTSGDVNWAIGNFDSAESDYSEALALASQFQGKDRESVADAKKGLGLTLYARGQLDESTPLLREAVNEYRNLPHTRWKLPQAINSLAQVLTWKNEFDEALTLLWESETMSLEVFGENNPYYPRSLWLQVYALCFKGECAAAEKRLEKAEEISDRFFSDNRLTQANNYDARNIMLTRTGRAVQAEPFGRKAIELYQTIMTRGTGGITLARIHLAESLIAQKKYVGAEEVLLEAYKDASEVQGVDHWRTKDVAKQLVSLYETTGKSELAASYK